MLFVGEISDFKIVYNVLKATLFKEFAVVRPMKEGLKITIDDMKCVETSVYVPSEMFTSYHIDSDEDIKFKVSLKVLTECLHIYGDDGNPSLKMTYKSAGAPLCLIIVLVEESITVDCEIRTMSVDDFSDISLAEECKLNKVVVNATQFSDVLTDLDNTADEMQLILGPEPPYFKIITNSAMGESEVEISKNSEMVILFQCKKAATTHYAFNNIRQVLKVMAFANKVSISTGESGLLGLQLLINNDERQLFVEYYVTALFGVE